LLHALRIGAASATVQGCETPRPTDVRAACTPSGQHTEELAHEKETQMSILGWIVFGLIVGAVAKLVMPGRDGGGIIVTMLLGIVGAMVGGFVGRAMNLYGPNDAAGFFMATLGAVVVLALWRMVSRGSTAPRV
jgi:uncharacterized membrane protein YeaQ/YmgE (transglycosylase-associated protein family)